MKLITCLEELKANLITLESYIDSETETDRQFHHDLIKKGVCFVAYSHNKQHYFAPSRFVGYISNNCLAHLANDKKDGRETNVAISGILNSKPESDDELNASYMRFCTRIGIRVLERGAFGVKRKFWKLGSLT